MTKQEYLDSTAIYHPAGGHRTGKIYDVRDTSVGTAYNIMPEDIVTSESAWSRLGYVTLERGYRDYKDNLFATKVTRDNTRIQLSEENVSVPQLGSTYTYSIEVKKGSTGSIIGISNFLMADGDNSAVFNLDTGTVDTPSNNGTEFITDLGDGWFRIGYSFTPTSDNKAHFNLNAGSNVSYDTIDGDYIFVSHPQIIEKPTYEKAKRKINFDLEVTGGGGTRILADGSVEDLSYNLIYPSADDLGNSWASSGITVLNDTNTSKVPRELTVQYDTTSSYVYFNQQFNQGDIHNWSAFFKREIGRYLAIVIGNTSGTRYRKVLWVDFETKTLLKTENVDTENPLTVNNILVEDKGGDWVRVSLSCEQVTSDRNLFVFSTTDNVNDRTDKVGKTVTYAGGQVTKGSELKPLQVSNGVAQFPKIDYSTGQPAFLIEPQSTNRIHYYNNFIAGTGWTGGNYTAEIDSTVKTPEGDDAYKVTRIGNSGDILYKAITDRINVIGGTGVFSLYIRGTGSDMQLRVDGEQLVIPASEFSDTEWRRFYLPCNGTLTDNVNIKFHIYEMNNPMYIYGAQFELNHLIPTSLIPTNGINVTRTDNYYKLPTSAINSLPVTIDFKVKRKNTDSAFILHGTDSQKYQGINIQILPDGEMQIRYGNNAFNSSAGRKDFVTTGANLNDLNWHEIKVECLSFNTVQVSIDGNSVTTGYDAGSAEFVDLTNDHFIGRKTINGTVNGNFELEYLKIT